MEAKLTLIVPYLMVVCANIFYVICNSCMKQLSSVFTLYELNYCLNGIVFILTLIYSYFRYAKLFLDVQKDSALILLIIRTTLSTISIILMIFNYISIPISFACTLHNLTPLFLLFLESFYYKLPLKKMHLFFTFVSFMGVLLILRPDTLFKSEALQYKGLGFYVLIGFFQAFCYSASFLALKEVKKEESIDNKLVLNYFYLFNLIVSGILMNSSSAERSIHWQIWMITPFCIMIFAVIMGQNLFYKSLFLGDPTLLMPFSYAGIVASIIADFYLFGEHIDLLGIVGIFLTSLGLISKLVLEK